MEPQVTFIPKKPIEGRVTAENRVSVVAVVAVIAFFSAIGYGAYSYYKQDLLKKSIAELKTNLKKIENDFDIKTVENIVRFDSRIKTAQSLLQNHNVVSPIFSLLSKYALRDIKFSSFSYKLAEASNGASGSAPSVGGSVASSGMAADQGERDIIIVMSGEARGYLSIALQSQAFAQSPYVKGQVFANLAQGDKGNVMFQLTLTLDPKISSFSDYLTRGGSGI